MVKQKIFEILTTAFLCIIALILVSPVLWITLLSLEGRGQAYIDFWIWNPQYVHALSNSIIIASGTAIGAILVAIPAAYVFAKVNFKGRDILFYLYIILMMMPFQVTLLPQYIVSRDTGIYDTLLAVIVPGIFTPFPVFLLTQIMKSIPNELIEAARLDTVSTLQILMRIIVPHIYPGIICAWALSFTEVWNMVAEPLVLLENNDLYPLAVLLGGIQNDDITGFAAAAVFLFLPLLIFALFEEEIIEGLEEYRLK